MEINTASQAVTYIYALTDPRETDDVKRIRYIGKAKNLGRRFSQHLWDVRNGTRTHCGNWIRTLFPSNLLPVLEILSVVGDPDASRMEQETIARYRLLGAPLTNLTDGGEGTLGWEPSPETCAKIGAANRGRVVSPETRAKMSAAAIGNRNSMGNKACVGRHYSEETLSKMSAAMKGRVPWNKGKRASPEAIAKNSAAHKGQVPQNKGKKTPPEVIAKMMGNKNALGCHRSDETKARMSAARRAYWAARKVGLVPTICLLS